MRSQVKKSKMTIMMCTSNVGATVVVWPKDYVTGGDNRLLTKMTSKTRTIILINNSNSRITSMKYSMTLVTGTYHMTFVIDRKLTKKEIAKL